MGVPILGVRLYFTFSTQKMDKLVQYVKLKRRLIFLLKIPSISTIKNLSIYINMSYIWYIMCHCLVISSIKSIFNNIMEGIFNRND